MPVIIVWEKCGIPTLKLCRKRVYVNLHMTAHVSPVYVCVCIACDRVCCVVCFVGVKCV